MLQLTCRLASPPAAPGPRLTGFQCIRQPPDANSRQPRNQSLHRSAVMPSFIHASAAYNSWMAKRPGKWWMWLLGFTVAVLLYLALGPMHGPVQLRWRNLVRSLTPTD